MSALLYQSKHFFSKNIYIFGKSVKKPIYYRRLFKQKKTP